jgi:7-carboxy-7-deazaguanine synthase
LNDELLKPARLRINEIFHSLQGEADAVGFRTVFVRLTGCPLRCQYCDTAYAFHAGEWHDIDAILETVESFRTPHVCVTGGEPLAQPNCRLLLARLCDAGHQVSLETSGAMDIAGVDARVARVVDVKTPGSGEVLRNRPENFPLLTRRDQVKFVICSRRALPGVVLSELHPSVAHRTRGLDFSGAAAGTFSTAAAQDSVGRRSGKMKPGT